MEILQQGQHIIFGLKCWKIGGFMENGEIFITRGNDYEYVKRNQIRTKGMIFNMIKLFERKMNA